MSAVDDTVSTMDAGLQQLGEVERDVLDFERTWWKFAGAKETAIAERFGWSATRYYQVLNALLDEQAALEHDPMLVRRLQRIREARRAQRASRRGA